MNTQARKKATIADVARLAGVSRSTASRALNDSPRISTATKRHIHEIAKEIGFTPNAQARALAVGKSETIAILITEPLNEFLTDPTYGVVLAGITEYLSQYEYLPVLLQAYTEHERERVHQHLLRQSFDAVIHISPYQGNKLLEVLQEQHIPTVLCGQLEGNPYQNVFSTVYADDIEGSILAARTMQQVGRKHVVAIVGPKQNPAALDRVSGYREVFGDALADDHIIYTGWDASDGFTAMMHLLEQCPNIDGVLAGSDRIASGVLEALHSKHVNVPEDVAVIGFDDHPVAESTTPALTTIRQPLFEEGKTAAKIALQMLDGAPATTTVMHMQLIKRQSL